MLGASLMRTVTLRQRLCRRAVRLSRGGNTSLVRRRAPCIWGSEEAPGPRPPPPPPPLYLPLCRVAGVHPITSIRQITSRVRRRAMSRCMAGSVCRPVSRGPVSSHSRSGDIGSSHWRHLPRAAAICKGLESALPLDHVVRGLCLTVICVTFQSCYPDLCISSEKRRKFHVD